MQGSSSGGRAQQTNLEPTAILVEMNEWRHKMSRPCCRTVENGRGRIKGRPDQAEGQYTNYQWSSAEKQFGPLAQTLKFSTPHPPISTGNATFVQPTTNTASLVTQSETANKGTSIESTQESTSPRTMDARDHCPCNHKWSKTKKKQWFKRLPSTSYKTGTNQQLEKGDCRMGWQSLASLFIVGEV